MKMTIALFFITVINFSGGVQDSTQQEPLQPPLQQVLQEPQKVIVNPEEVKIDKRTDSIKGNYFKAISNRSISLQQLIIEKKQADSEIVKLNAEIKRLKKVNHFLKQNIDTVYIRDTVFKKRKILQIFKN